MLHTHTQWERGVSPWSVEVISSCEFSQEPPIPSIFNSLEIVFLSDVIAVPALSNGRKDCASEKSTEKCTKAWTAAYQDTAAIFNPVVHRPRTCLTETFPI